MELTKIEQSFNIDENQYICIYYHSNITNDDLPYLILEFEMQGIFFK